MKNSKRATLLLICLLMSSILSAQPAPPESANRTPIPGFIILAAAGAAIGASKLNKASKSD